MTDDIERELVLAQACERGDTEALAEFRVAYFVPLEPALARMGLDSARRDDVWQALAIRLFVGDPPKIMTYAGRGQLHGLVKVAATRLALDALERERHHTSDDWLECMPGSRSDPELHWMRAEQRASIKEEVERAISALPTRDRALLRLTLIERVGIDAIARIYRMHRSTAARWIVRVRDELATRVQAQLGARWSVPPGDLHQLAFAVDSQLDLSLDRLLSAS
jgi:RNA polymerase sigma-70 factor (ECF subfamily)